ncbi:hypothetical protein KAT60_00520 [Candidatus Woesebacteria bacterium]|nr:hypothetical protein [Candidatus Woesebacteria bacterium]
MKKTAKKTTKQLVHEPLEVLKTARKQVVGKEKITRPEPDKEEAVREGEKVSTSLEEEKIKAKSKRLLEALETEIEEIRKRKKLEEEEKLKEEELKVQAEEEKKKQKPLVEPSSRRPRKIMKGMKGKLQKLKRKTEIRMPPSG